MPLVHAAVRLPVPAGDAFALHADVRNLPLLTPPPGARVLYAASPTQAGDVQVLALGPRWAAIRWVAHVTTFEPPRLMIDEQRRGPFKRFRHAHLVVPDGDSSVLVDLVDFRLFGGPLGGILDRLLVAPVLQLTFAARHRRTVALLRGGWPAYDREQAPSVADERAVQPTAAVARSS